MSKYSIDWVGMCCAQNPHLITAQLMNAVTILAKDSQIILSIICSGAINRVLLNRTYSYSSEPSLPS
jgi:hypothetical protein